MIDLSVVLDGDFDRDEREYLREAFDHCRIELVARSKVDDAVALIRWSPTRDEEASNVTDRRRVPTHAYYVLSSDDPFDLTPIHSGAELGELFPGHFDAGLIDPPRPAGCLPGVFGGLRR